MNAHSLKLVAALACSTALPLSLTARGDVQRSPLQTAVIETPANFDARTSRCHADVDGDQAIGFSDLIAVLASWGACPIESIDTENESGAIEIVGCAADLDRNHAVDYVDLTIVLVDYGRACEYRAPETDPDPEP